jgi:homoserine kinase
MDSVTVRIPATTANLGPGYDCLGVALQLYNHVTVRRSESTDQSLRHPMIAAAARAFFGTARRPAFEFDFEIAGEVPRSRGLGSSVTVRLGILHGLNVLCDSSLGADCLFETCARLEGHPDNAAPAAFGGFTVAGGEKVARFEVEPSLHFVLLIPDFEIATPDARRVLPPQLERLAAVQSCANACRITAAFTSRRYELLSGSFADGLHQPFRKMLIPFLDDVIRAGEDAGALGGFLSGSGSTICCVTLESPEHVGEAMLAASGQTGARIVITQADNDGARIFPPK